MLFLLLLVIITAGKGQLLDIPNPPTLQGQHFRITGLTDGEFLQVGESEQEHTGFLADFLRQLAKDANFTYDLVKPSGFGEQCVPQLNETTRSKSYDPHYRTQYNCGANDVQDLQGTPYAADIYLGMFYTTPYRRLKNWFTVPFQPPHIGTPAMYGTSTGIATIQELIEQQAQGNHPPVCMAGSTATLTFVQSVYPGLQIKPYYGNHSEYDRMNSGECPMYLVDAPIAAQFVLRMSKEGTCQANGRSIGVIGEPMKSGLSHYAIGVGNHLDRHVVDTLSFWIDVFMMSGQLAAFYEGQGGTGKECGYVLYPQDEPLMSVGGIVMLILGAVLIVCLPLLFFHRYRLKKQQARYKKRFVQQIARNIQIGRRPDCIPPDKLSEEILHIGKGKDYIQKEDLSQWMHDIKLNFISDKDFDALWSAMDIDGKGRVAAVDFVVFLSACGPEFEQVYEEQLKMPKLERLKLAARRLSVIATRGEQGVRDIERSLEMRSQAASQRSNFLRRSSSTRSMTGHDIGREPVAVDRFSSISKDSVEEALETAGEKSLADSVYSED